MQRSQVRAIPARARPGHDDRVGRDAVGGAGGVEVGVEGVGEVGEEGEDGGEDVVAGGGAEEGVVGVEECVAGAEGSVWLVLGMK